MVERRGVTLVSKVFACGHERHTCPRCGVETCSSKFCPEQSGAYCSSVCFWAHRRERGL